MAITLSLYMYGLRCFVQKKQPTSLGRRSPYIGLAPGPKRKGRDLQPPTFCTSISKIPDIAGAIPRRRIVDKNPKVPHAINYM